jgi:hypothetical protein
MRYTLIKQERKGEREADKHSDIVKYKEKVTIKGDNRHRGITKERGKINRK